MIKPDLKIFISFMFLTFFSISIFAMKIDEKREVAMKHSFSDSIVNQLIEMERATVIESANNFLDVKPRTVTANSCSRSMGGKHDFFSEGPYWWPDPANPNAAYVRHDGLRNPNRFENHDDDLRFFSWIVGNQTSAYILTGEEKYVKSAMRQMNAWFVDSTTKMNPNLIYAQAIHGICTGRGIGIIDAVPLMDVAQSLIILEKSPYASRKEIAQIKEWFTQFIAWLTKHPYGIDEMNTKNNHTTWWHAQVSIYARLVGDQKMLQLCLRHYKEILLPNQMAADGSFPQELARTKPFSYSLFNLDAMVSLTWILSDNSFEVWNFSLPDGRGIKKGLDFIWPYLNDKTNWPYKKDVSHWDEQPDSRQFMLFAALADNNPKWFSLWKSLGEKNKNDQSRLALSKQNSLLWIGLANIEKYSIYKNSGIKNKWLK